MTREAKMKMSRFYRYCDALLRYNEQLDEQQVCVGSERLTRAQCLQRWSTVVRDNLTEADVVVEKTNAKSSGSDKSVKTGGSKP
jgi:hypothetical protein